MNTKEEVMNDLRTIVASFEDREYSGELTEETLLFADMGFMSIDAVVLGEKLENHFGRTLPFPTFLGELAEKNATDIRVGDLADFICSSLSA